MTDMIISVGTKLYKQKKEFYTLIRFISIFCLIGYLPFLSTNISEVVYGSIRDAYVGVSVWVGLTLTVFYSLEKYLKLDFEAYLKDKQKYQVSISALLGALPGCGGALIITTQYSKGNITLGALVATLTSTMGDAAFLLIASTPKEALIIMLISIVVGSLTGYIVDMFSAPKWILNDKKSKKNIKNKIKNINASFWKSIDSLWLFLFLPGIFLGIANAIDVNPNLWFSFLYSNFADDLALIAGILSIAIFFSSPSENNPMDMTKQTLGNKRRIVAETSFITTWACLGFLMYDLTIYLTGWDLKILFQTIAPVVPLIAILIGWLPGCGPQIVVATLYINGTIPFSALAGNAISNDGDALFPTLAISPRAAILATAYSSIPALIVAYSIYYFFPQL